MNVKAVASILNNNQTIKSQTVKKENTTAFFKTPINFSNIIDER